MSYADTFSQHDLRRRQSIIQQDIAFQVALWNEHYANADQRMPRGLRAIAERMNGLRSAAAEAEQRREAAEAELTALKQKFKLGGIPGEHEQEIIDAVCRKHGVTMVQLKGRSRQVPIVLARQEAMALLVNDGLSYTQVGRILGHRDHTTVLYGAAQHKRRSAGVPA